ncbi:MAG TPA: pyridoxamine 5'-phosphate oxidase family protein [Planctomycetota bacterium]|jgi:hypothetical protein
MAQRKYHLQRIEKAMPRRADHLAVIRGQKFLSLAMCHGKQPYMVTLNYAFDEKENCFYAHCATKGRKLDYLAANPRVWGQVLEDRGYLYGKCSHAYRTVMFEGTAELVDDAAAKQAALALMVQQLDPKAKSFVRRIAGMSSESLEGVSILRIRAKEFSGKISPPPKR